MPASKKQAAAVKHADTGLNDESVREFLKNNGDFLQRNPDLLDHLHISHASGSAVSLVEKQVSVLRERNIDMRHRLKTLTHNARENDKLYELTRKLVLQLLEADSIADLYRTFMDSMHKDFGVEQASMILFGDDPDNSAYRVETMDKARIEIGALLRGHKAVCGALRKEELDYLFATGTPAAGDPAAGVPAAGDSAAGGPATGKVSSIEVGSAALMPLSNDEQLGLIAVGSADANRYTSTTGTLFLAHIADILVRLLPRLRPEGS